MCSESPDTSGINRAAESSAEVGRDALAFWKQIYEDSAPAREQATATANQVSLAQARGMDTATRLAEEAYAQGRPFREAERAMLEEANNFDTEAKREELAGLALGDVNQQFGAAKEQAMRGLQRTGVNPADGAYAGATKQITLAQALAGADAKNKARAQATTMGHAMKMDALSLARGLPGQQATQQNIALNAGNSAVGNAQVPLAVANSGGQMMQQGFNAAQDGNRTAGNLYGQIAQIQNQGSSGGDILGGIGSLGRGLGAMGMTFSDKNMKEARKPVDGKVALSAARKMPVDSWKYKKGSAGDDGGKTHVGPMAQDVQAAAGSEAAPGGKVIDLTSLAGVTLAAVQQVDKNVKRLEKKVLALSDAAPRKARRA